MSLPLIYVPSSSHIKLEEEDTIIFDAEDGFIKSLEDLAAESLIDEKEPTPELKDEGDVLPEAPDGGYGWVICSGVFMNHMIYGGLGRSEGLFFLQFQSMFGTSAQVAAWPGSLMSTLNLFMGPLCGAVVSRYSVRTAFIIGTSLCFTGMLLNAFAPNIYFLFLSHTILGGLGRGLMSGILLLNLYFDKHRSLATGLGSSGVGIGSLWVVPLTQFLFDEYGFTGAFLVLSSLCLHGFLMAMLFRPLRTHYRFMTAKRLKKNQKLANAEEVVTLTSGTNDSNENLPKEHLTENSHKLFTIHETGKDSENITPAESELLLEESSNTSSNDSRSSSVSIAHEAPEEAHENNLPLAVSEESLPLKAKQEEITALEKPKLKKDGFLSSSLKICFPVEFKRQGETKRSKSFHWSLLKHVPFMVFCISNFFFILAFKTAFTFLPAIAMSKGLTKQEAALILTISGALDTFGRMATGFLMDFRVMRPFRPYCFNLLLFGIAGASLLMPSLNTFASFSIVCALYGFMTGSFIAQKMVVLVDILGREMMPSSLGIQKVFQGFGTLIGPPFAGALRDALGNYDSSFYLGGASMFGAGLMLVLSNVLLRIRNRKYK